MPDATLETTEVIGIVKKTCLAAIIYVTLCTGAALAHTHHAHHTARHVATHSATIPNVGFATWYGNGYYKNKNGFHHFTSDGERFNPRAMTCAHRTIPFNTLVKVVDLDTGKHIDCRVNDRMGARPPRIIDLTLGAAKALGIERAGKVRVRLEPVELAESPR